MNRVLVVEDKAPNLDLMCYLLGAVGYDVVTAEDGAAGVRLAGKARPDLVLMDLHMPVMDGFEATALLKQDPDLRSIPVIAVSALAMVGDREKVLAAGFDGYVSKPIEPAAFIEEIARFLPGEAASP